jgi:hypothetical protein
MNSGINYDLAQARTADLLRDAQHARLARAARANRKRTRPWRRRPPADEPAWIVIPRSVPQRPLSSVQENA